MRSASFPPKEAERWQRIRRYTGPRSMIEQATERRLAGDWRGACAAAGLSVDVDLAQVRRTDGTAMAETLEDDLAHFAPDLLRWHLPRNPLTMTVTPGKVIVLTAHGPEQGRTPQLHVATPRTEYSPQRLTLKFGPVVSRVAHVRRAPSEHNWADSRHLWDVRHSAGLLERCGGDSRPPFFHADGTPVEPRTAGPAGPGDPAAHAEWTTWLLDHGDVEQAMVSAGIELTASHPRARPALLRKVPLALTRIADEIRRLAAIGSEHTFQIRVDRQTALLLSVPGRDARLRAELTVEHAKDIYELPETFWRRLPDLDLLRSGRVTPEELHPLVRSALFPGRPDPAQPIGPPDPRPPYPVRVPCDGEMHKVTPREGRLDLPHSQEEQQRERAMRALGGANPGCFAIEAAWTTGTGWLPKGLLRQREDVFLRAEHGDTDGILRLLDAGLHPGIRSHVSRTLLHWLAWLDHKVLLPRLLAAGLDINVTDRFGGTPLHRAVMGEGSDDLVKALLAAGARVDIRNHEWRPAHSYLDVHNSHLRPLLDPGE